MSKENKPQSLARRRTQSIFNTMPVSNEGDDVDHPADRGPGPVEVYHADRVLANGDFYTGQWADNLPHGYGKYLWTDGCMYVGEWSRGKTMGRGKFCWPSGATYEGEFRSGLMEGKGTYTGPSGDTYRGQWAGNLKHGQGTKSYPNGDYYEGEWRQGLQDGQGRYQWKNGNNYVGQWKNGVINGNGTMVWSNGNRYDGYWEDGLPKGNGTFRWADGSFYVGVWSKDPKEQSGSYYPSGLTGGVRFENFDPQKLFAFDLNDLKISTGEKVLSVLPSQKKLNVPTSPRHQKGSDAGKPRRTSVDAGRVYNYNWDSDGTSDSQNGNGDEGLGGNHFEDMSARSTSTPRQKQLKIQLVKRPGETISKGHKNYDLMLNLQLGIRYSVARPAPATSFDLKASAFDPKEKLWTKFPPEGSKHTPPHQSCEFKWKDYCPVVFRTLRKLFKVDTADYMISLCGNDALRELSSPGKSGSFFYLTNDDRYMIKTLKKAEVKMLLKMLPAYYNHVRAFENTLVTKFFGLHCVKLIGSQKKVRFVIMGNLFCSEYTIHRRFDLKGSSHGRTTDKPEAEITASTTLKDLDLNFIFRLQRVWFQEFCRQVDWDCDFLEQEKIMDYSLLVGVHFRQISNNKDSFVPEPCTPRLYTPRGTMNQKGNADFGNASARASSVSTDQHILDPNRWASIKLGMNMLARAELTVRRTDFDPNPVEPTGELYDVIMFFGIIDILQDYDITKKLEHAYKSIQHNPTSISAVDPKQYARRFRDFMFRVFIEDT